MFWLCLLCGGDFASSLNYSCHPYGSLLQPRRIKLRASSDLIIIMDGGVLQLLNDDNSVLISSTINSTTNERPASQCDMKLI